MLQFFSNVEDDGFEFLCGGSLIAGILIHQISSDSGGFLVEAIVTDVNKLKMFHFGVASRGIGCRNQNYKPVI